MKTNKNDASVTLLSLKLNFPGCTSLKDKRRKLQQVLSRLRNEFNVSVAETGLQDYWQSAWISCVLVSNDARYNVQITNEIIHFVEAHFPDHIIEEQQIESR